MLTAEQLVQHYHLQPHPEGGWYRETYRSKETIQGDALQGQVIGVRNVCTAIYFLLEGNQFSAFHRIKSDEMWHFYAGDVLNVYVIHHDGLLEIIRLGNNPLNGETYQAVVPANCWFASRPATADSFSFVGCTVAPGFDFADFEMANRAALTAEYSAHAVLIQQLTRL